MAWRIGQAVVRGEMDNTTEGLTTGRIWLLGGARAARTGTAGDCWRDLAGSRVEFENPEPEFDPDLLAGLAGSQRGLVGDITASRRTRGGIGPGQWQRVEAAGDDPDAWRNCLYIEWFSEANGRVVIESDQFAVQPGEPHWRMDADAEQAQKIANLQAMRDYLAGVIRRREPARGGRRRHGELSEFEWEDRLEESDRLTDAYQEVLEKYVDEADAEQKEAFVMGWDRMLGGPEEGDEAEFDDDLAGADDWDDDAAAFAADDEFPEEDPAHPLQAQAHELAMRAMDLVRREVEERPASSRMVANLLQVSGKLAGALNGRSSGYRPEAGFVLAVLKRCLAGSTR